MTCDEFLRRLHPYLDGELDPAAVPVAEEHLAHCPACQAQVARYRALGAAVRAAMAAPATPSLQGRAHQLLRDARARSRRSRWMPVLLACAAVVLLWVGWQATRTQALDDADVRDVAALHQRSQLPGHLIDLTTSDPSAIAPWFARQLPYTPWTGVLGKECVLLGARMDYCDHQRVAVLVYQHGSHLISLITYPSDAAGDHSRALVTRDGVTLCGWSQNHLQFFMVSDLPQDELEHISRMVPPSSA